MKTGDLKNLSLQEIVQQLQLQNLQKQDFVVPSRFIKMVGSNLQVINEEKLDSFNSLLAQTGISINENDVEKMHLQVLDCCHSQIGSKLEIPKKYYDRMLSEKYHHLLDYNVSTWFSEKGNTNYFLRTFIDAENRSGIARAILSDRYNVLDNYDVMLATLDAIRESGINVQIESGDITDTKFYMRFVCPDIELEAPDLLKNYRVPDGTKGGNGIISGFVISNSETGNGKFSISPRALVLACRNGMIFKNDAFAKTHLGSKMEEYSTIDWSEETRQKNYDLVISQVKDAIKFYASQEYLTAKIHELSEKGNKELSHPIETIKNVTKSLSISEEKESNILNYFIKSGDTNAFGVTQALTYFAQHNATPEERFDIETNSVLILDNIDDFDKPEVNIKRVPSSQIVSMN
jgi:hypothetical protein